MIFRGNCHENAVAESFFRLLKRERMRKGSTERGKRSTILFFITFKCLITVNVGMVRANRCYRRNIKTNTINDSEVSRLPVAVHRFYRGE